MTGSLNAVQTFWFAKHWWETFKITHTINFYHYTEIWVHIHRKLYTDFWRNFDKHKQATLTLHRICAKIITHSTCILSCALNLDRFINQTNHNSWRGERIMKHRYTKTTFLFITLTWEEKKIHDQPPPPHPWGKTSNAQWLYNPGVDLLPDNLPLPVICA